jgi:hypothetical protein
VFQILPVTQFFVQPFLKAFLSKGKNAIVEKLRRNRMLHWIRGRRDEEKGRVSMEKKDGDKNRDYFNARRKGLRALAVMSAALMLGAGVSHGQSDKVNSVSGPTSVSPNTNVTVTVGYTVSGARTIKVHFQRTTDWSWYGAGQASVASGTGTVNISVPTGSSSNGSGYRYGVEILNGNTQTATGQQTGVTVGSSSVYNRVRKNLGTNLGIIVYSNEDQSTNNFNGANVFHQKNPNFAGTSNPWNPAFLEDIKPYQTIRFMDWFGGNGDGQVSWSSNRTRKADGIQAGKWMGPKGSDGYDTDQPPSVQSDGRNTWGVAVEWLIDVVNRNQSDMWLNIPYRVINSDDFPNGDDYSNEYVHKLAILLKTGVDMKAVSLKNWVGGKANLGQLSGKSKQDFINAGGSDTGYSLSSNLKLYVEYSNEAWCCSRPQVKWLEQQRSKVGLQNSQWDRRWWAWAEVRVWKAFQDVFGKDAMGNRVIRVAGPTHRENGTAGAFAGFFNDVYNNTAANRNPWRNTLGVYPDAWKWASYIGGHPDNWNASVNTDATNNKNFAAAMKSTYGLKYFLSYEGGQHLDYKAGPFSWSNGYNAYDAYKYWLNAEDDAFDLICHYGHYGRWQSSTDGSGYGSWGAKSYVGQPNSESGKYRALKDYIDGK